MMNELQETIKSICDDFADISAILAARSRELDRRVAFDEEISEQINSILKMKKGDKVKTWISTQIGTVKKVLGNGRVVVVFKGSKVEYELDPAMVKLV